MVRFATASALRLRVRWQVRLPLFFLQRFSRARTCSFTNCDAVEHSRFLVTSVACTDLSESTIFDLAQWWHSFGLWATAPSIVRLVLVHVDVVPEHHVSVLIFLQLADGL